MEAPPKELLLAQSERYVEYSRKGQVIKGEERPKIKSRFEEDVYVFCLCFYIIPHLLRYPMNHKAVFGSYWENGVWGYKCCHSFVKNSYCTGEDGIKANKAKLVPTGKVEVFAKKGKIFKLTLL